MLKSKGLSVLFVCTGNTCRSPMAQAMLQARLPRELEGQVRVLSAGTAAAPGMPASANTLAVLSRAGIRLEGHLSRRLSPEMLDGSDLVLAVTPDHRRAILALAPEAADKTFVLSSFASPTSGEEELVVHDPVGGSIETYEETMRRIGTHLDRILPEILGRVGAG